MEKVISKQQESTKKWFTLGILILAGGTVFKLSSLKDEIGRAHV